MEEEEEEEEEMCVSVALVMQHAKHMRHIILSFEACLYLSYFFALELNKSKIFVKKFQNKMCFDFLQNFCLKHF
jgi:hypothetical protein